MTKTLLLIICIFSLQLYGFDGVIYGEGPISSLHDKEFSSSLEKYFYTNKQLDAAKLEETISFFKKERSRVQDSVYLFEKTRFINLYRYTNDEASKKAKKELKRIRLSCLDLIER
jgi:hypothetical protein